MTVLSYGLSLTNSAFLGPLRIAKNAVGGFSSQLSNVGNIITGLASLPGAIQTLVAPLTQPITLSSDFEAMETSFKSLLKSAPAAKAMVKDLMQFADVTPFDPVPVAATGKQLLAFGFAAKEVKPLLKDIGDLAAAMDKPLEEVGDAFGRLKAGQFGEAFERMRAFGISMQDLEGAGLTFDKSGQFKGSADQALEAVRQIIRRKFGGGMADLATTFKGLFSTFQGYWDALQRSFGTPIMQALKPVLEDGTALLQQWAPIAEDFGKKLATGVLVIREMFKNGTLTQGLGLGLQAAGAMLINQLYAGFQGFVNMLFTGLAEAAGIFQSLLADPKIWNGIRVYMLAIGEDIKAAFYEAGAGLLTQIPMLGGNASNLKEMAELARGNADIKRGVAASELSGGDLPSIVKEIGEAVKNTGSSFLDGYQNAPQLIDPSQYTDRLGALIAPALQNAEAFFSKQNSNDEPAKKTATKVEGILKFIDQNGITVVRNLQLIADNITNLNPGVYPTS